MLDHILNDGRLHRSSRRSIVANASAILEQRRRTNCATLHLAVFVVPSNQISRSSHLVRQATRGGWLIIRSFMTHTDVLLVLGAVSIAILTVLVRIGTRRLVNHLLTELWYCVVFSLVNPLIPDRYVSTFSWDSITSILMMEYRSMILKMKEFLLKTPMLSSLHTLFCTLRRKVVVINTYMYIWFHTALLIHMHNLFQTTNDLRWRITYTMGIWRNLRILSLNDTGRLWT